MKKSIRFALSFLTCLVLLAGVSVYVMAHDADDDYRSHYPHEMSLEEAKEKFFRVLDETGFVCWVTEGIPLEFTDEIRQARIAIESELFEGRSEAINVESLSLELTNLEFYQQMLADYLEGRPYALSSDEIHELAELAAQEPDGIVRIGGFYFPDYESELYNYDVDGRSAVRATRPIYIWLQGSATQANLRLRNTTSTSFRLTGFADYHSNQGRVGNLDFRELPLPPLSFATTRSVAVTQRATFAIVNITSPFSERTTAFPYPLVGN